jgi:hypothetical protein
MIIILDKSSSNQLLEYGLGGDNRTGDKSTGGVFIGRVAGDGGG